MRVEWFAVPASAFERHMRALNADVLRAATALKTFAAMAQFRTTDRQAHMLDT
jgi:hypothetical protein